MSVKVNRIPAEDYKKNFADVHPKLTASKAVVEANRCLFCYDAPCIKACPTSIDVPKFIKQISSDNIKGSAYTIMSANIFGAGCARVCPTEKLCEGACVLNHLHEDPIPIGKLQRHSTDQMLENNWKLFHRKPNIAKKVAVIGAGPAGLSCAHTLSREGIDIDVYEKKEKGGGLMTYGVAGYKVTPEFCQSEVDHIISLGGIQIHYETALGDDITLDELKEKYDAVFIGIGLGKTRSLNIPGEKLEGVVDAISLIHDIRSKDLSKIPIGSKVVVIGMGMTAIDAARQSRRLGASDVTLVYRRSKDEMPSTEKEYKESIADGCNTIWLASPKEIKGSNGKVSSISCQKMKLGAMDASGRKRPETTDEIFELKTDMVIKALGQLPFENLFGQVKLDSEQGRLLINESRQTTIANIFAGGDCINGGAEVVDAVEDGKLAARGILNYIGVAAD